MLYCPSNPLSYSVFRVIEIVVDIIHSPVGNGANDLHQFTSESGQRIFNMGRNFGKDGSGDDAIAFKLAKLFRQDRFGAIGKIALDAAKARVSFNDVMYNQQLPLSEYQRLSGG